MRVREQCWQGGVGSGSRGLVDPGPWCDRNGHGEPAPRDALLPFPAFHHLSLPSVLGWLI